MSLLRNRVRDEGLTLLLVTHDMGVARYADRIVHPLDGHIQRIEEVGERDGAVVDMGEAQEIIG